MSEPDLKATAWCFSAPAVLMNLISLAKKPLPATAGDHSGISPRFMDVKRKEKNQISETLTTSF
jgi:hypothetical protein